MLIFMLGACNPTRYVSQGEYLLDSYAIESDNKTIKNDQLKSYVRQKPNKRIIGVRFHLWLFNRSKPEKENKWNNWLRKYGEEPVIFQESMTEKSREQLKLFFESKGYYYAQVTDTVLLKQKRADVRYKIHSGWPYRISRVDYDIADTAISRLVLSDTARSLVSKNVLLDVGILEQERKRIETYLRDRGYFNFSEDYISYKADTSHQNRTVSLELNIRPYTERSADNQMVEKPFPIYTIRAVTVNASLSMRNLMNVPDAPKTMADTIMRDNMRFIIPKQFPVKSSTISQQMYIFPDSLYRVSNANRTYQHLLGLRNFQQVNIEFTEVPGQATATHRELDGRINILPLPRQSHQEDIEGTNSGGNIGGAVSVTYQNKSLFGHAEIFDLRLRGMIEAVSKTDETFKFKNTFEYEAEASLNIPKFLLPFRSQRFIQRYNPKTSFSILYNHQRRPDYTRSVFSTSFGYNWKGSDVITHIVKPLDVNFVNLLNVSDQFQEQLDKYPYLKNSYQTHMVVSSNYTFIRDMQSRNPDNFFYFRTNVETAGLLLDAIFKMTDNSGKPYKISGNAFSQFVKADFNLIHYYTISGNNRLVSRIFMGIGWPYGNSVTDGEDGSVATMPFEKKYYSGGANSVRGWQLRSLGPGSYYDPEMSSTYPNNTGDMKLEANLEYRFKLIGIVEGALFMDAGNVWDTHKDATRPGANFSFNRFYKEIALSGGVGIRFDFKFFILRTDLGMKLYNPVGAQWLQFDKINRNTFSGSISIGYPFM